MLRDINCPRCPENEHPINWDADRTKFEAKGTQTSQSSAGHQRVKALSTAEDDTSVGNERSSRT